MVLSFFGILIGWVIDMILTVAAYNDFINAPAVIQGWTVVRDLGNMAFIVILLIIGFGSMFSRFEVSQYLPKIVIYSILVNFSRTVCGLMIDASQVVMLTFVNAFKDAGAGNFVNALGLSKIVSLQSQNTNFTSGTTQIFLAALLGVVLTMLALGILGALLAFLLERVIMLWVLVALSPAAFILRALPPSKLSAYSSKWWAAFSKYLTTGPILAFFLWLALSISSTVGASADQGLAAKQGLITGQTNAASATDISGTDIPGSGNLISDIGNAQGVLNFIISAAMLMVGMGIAKSSGGLAGSFAGKFQGSGALGAIGLGKGGIGRRLATLGPAGKYVSGYVGGALSPVKEAWKDFGKGASERGERLGLAGVGLLAGAPAVLGGKQGLKARQKQRDNLGKEISEADKLYNVHGMDDSALSAGIHIDKNKARQVAKLREMMRRGIIKDTPEHQEAVNSARGLLGRAPEQRIEFDKSVKKASPELAASTIYNNFASSDDVDRFFRDVKADEMNLPKALAKMTAGAPGTHIQNMFDAYGGRDQWNYKLASSQKDEKEYMSLVNGFDNDRKKILFGEMTPGGLPLTAEEAMARYKLNPLDAHQGAVFASAVEGGRINLENVIARVTDSTLQQLNQALGGTANDLRKVAEYMVEQAKDAKDLARMAKTIGPARANKMFSSLDLLDPTGPFADPVARAKVIAGSGGVFGTGGILMNPANPAHKVVLDSLTDAVSKGVIKGQDLVNFNSTSDPAITGTVVSQAALNFQPNDIEALHRAGNNDLKNAIVTEMKNIVNTTPNSPDGKRLDKLIKNLERRGTI